MITIKYFLFAKSATIDSFNNQLSVYNIIEELHSSEVPSILADSALAICFERDIAKDASPEHITVSIEVNGKSAGEQNFTIDFLSTSRNRTLLNIPFLQLNEFGKLTFNIKLNRKLLGSYTLKVIKTPLDSQTPNTIVLQPASEKKL